VIGSAAIGFNGGSQATSKGRSSFEMAGRPSARDGVDAHRYRAIGRCLHYRWDWSLDVLLGLRLVIQAADKPFSEFLSVSLYFEVKNSVRMK
jgi:hypothetical protein